MSILAEHNHRVVEYHIKSIQESINKKSDFFIVYSDIDSNLDDEIKCQIDKKRSKKYNNDNVLSILLDTNGGTPDALKRTVDFLRSLYGEINFYVIGKAMSAGTMFCMSGDNIYMSNEACLGPIDPQVIIDGKRVPAQAHFESMGKFSKQTTVITSRASNGSNI